jgi:hypothetical protein
MIYSLLIIILIFFLIICLLLTNNNQNKHNSTENFNNMCPKKNIRQNIEEKIQNHISKINNNPTNRNLYKSNDYLSYNISDLSEYNILNSYGPKYSQNLLKFNKKINNNDTVSYNHYNVLNNYNKNINKNINIDNKFKIKEDNIEQIGCINYEFNCHDKINILGRWINEEDEYLVTWSYPSNCFNNSIFNIYYKEINKCSKNINILQENFKKINFQYDSIKQNTKLEFDNKIVLYQDTYQNRNIYKLLFKKFDIDKNYLIYITFNNQFRNITSNKIYS